jgi:hypothetical protein
MGCCGGKRSELRKQMAVAAAPVQPVRRLRAPVVPARRAMAVKPVTTAPQRIPENGPVTLHYLGAASMLIVGPVTGRQYRFSAAEASQRVARADVRRLLSTGLFRV